MLALPLLVSSMTCLPTGICICTLCDTPVLLLLSYGARQHMFVSCTECWSQGRAKLRAFPHHLARENTQLNPSLTPTLGSLLWEIMAEVQFLEAAAISQQHLATVLVFDRNWQIIRQKERFSAEKSLPKLNPMLFRLKH